MQRVPRDYDGEEQFLLPSDVTLAKALYVGGDVGVSLLSGQSYESIAHTVMHSTRYLIINDYVVICVLYLLYLSYVLFLLIKNQIVPWLGWLSGWSAGLQTKGCPIRFPVRAHAWVVGQVPRGRGVRGNHMLRFLSLPSPL